MVEILVPIFVVVILPISIVGIIFTAVMNKDNKRSQVLIKAIETNGGIDADKLAEALQRTNAHKIKKTARELLNLRLLRGCIFSFIGLVFCIVGIISLYVGSCSSYTLFTILLLIGGSLFAIGISYLIVYYVTRKQVKE